MAVTEAKGRDETVTVEDETLWLTAADSLPEHPQNKNNTNKTLKQERTLMFMDIFFGLQK